MKAHLARLRRRGSAKTTADQDPSAASGNSTRRWPWLALAASLIVFLSLASLFSPLGRQATTVVDRQQPDSQAPRSSDTTTPSPAPRLFALAVSPVAVRSGSDNPAIVIPPDADVVVVRLQSDGENRQLTPARAAIRTVSGDGVWDGRVASDGKLPAGVLAQIDVPAKTLPADDYLITLYGTERSGDEVEWTQYVLRVRSR
jgi:hypothetical protein